MTQGLVSAGKPACPSGRGGPITEVFCFAKRKVDLNSNWYNMGTMNDTSLAPDTAEAQFTIGDVVRHRIFDFRGVIFDVDPVFANSKNGTSRFRHRCVHRKISRFTTCLLKMAITVISLT